MPQLLRNVGSNEEKAYPLNDGPTSIGRSAGNDIVLFDLSLSRQHARVERSGEHFQVIDLGSLKGTYVNGKKVERELLKHGDQVRLGDVLLVFSARNSPRPTAAADSAQAAPAAPGLGDLVARDQAAERRSALRLRNQDAAQRSRDKLNLLLRVSELLSSPEAIDRLLERILDLLFEIVQAKHAVILLEDPTSGQLQPRIVKPAGAGNNLYSSQIVEHVRRNQVGMVTSNAQSDARFDATRSLLSMAIMSSMCVPLKARDHLIGVLYLDNSSPWVTFGEEDLEFISGFANQAGIAIENSLLYQKMEEQARDREQELVAQVEARTKDLAGAMEKAEKANQAKSRFLASMSHELRTPLNAIIGYSEMLAEEAEENGHEGYIADLQKVNYAGKHLLSLVNDILDYSKIEAGKIELFLEGFDVGEMIQGVIGTIQPLVAKNGNTLQVECQAGIGTIHSDLTKVKQSLFNLLSNACKFTKQGTISLQVRRLEAKGREPAHVVFDIRDTGIGMTPEQKDRLFQAFMQGDASTTREYGGTGLGLSISRHFCRMLGGDISVDSEAGKGSIFSMHVPVRTEPNPPV